jgi:hypothetical protein
MFLDLRPGRELALGRAMTSNPAPVIRTIPTMVGASERSEKIMKLHNAANAK